MTPFKLLKPIQRPWWYVLSLVLLLVLTGCGGAEGGPTATPSSPPPTATPEPTGRIALVFKAGQTPAGEDAFELYTVDDNGANLSQVSVGKGSYFDPRWSPDGNWLAFQAEIDGQWDVYLMSARSGEIQRLTHTPGFEGFSKWSPDGRYLGIPGPDPQADPPRSQPDVLVYDLAEQTLINLTRTPNIRELNLVWSSDGDYLVFRGPSAQLTRLDFSCVQTPETCLDTAFELGVSTIIESMWSSTSANAIGYGVSQDGKEYAALVALDGSWTRILDSVPLEGLNLVDSSTNGDQVLLIGEGYAFFVWDIPRDEVIPLGRSAAAAISPEGDRVAVYVNDELSLVDLDRLTSQDLGLSFDSLPYYMDWGPLPSQDGPTTQNP